MGPLCLWQCFFFIFNLQFLLSFFVFFYFPLFGSTLTFFFTFMVFMVITVIMVIMVIKVIMVIIITLHHHRQRTLTKWSPLTYIVSRPIDDLCHWYLGIWVFVLSLTMVTIVVMQIIMIFKAPTKPLNIMAWPLWSS